MLKTKKEKAIDAEQKAARYLADANLAAERGDSGKAERLYEKSQKWHDRMNKLSGND